MATRPPTEADAVTVRLSEVDADLRRAVAHELAAYWKLRGLPYAMWMLRVNSPTSDVSISVPVEKAAMVAEGKRPRGNLDNELKIRPMEFVR